jgi:hypothetical protein
MLASQLPEQTGDALTVLRLGTRDWRFLAVDEPKAASAQIVTLVRNLSG